jgi:hypothetical protein
MSARVGRGEPALGRLLLPRPLEPPGQKRETRRPGQEAAHLKTQTHNDGAIFKPSLPASARGSR